MILQNADYTRNIGFEGCFHKEGWLLLVCAQMDTANWVRENFSSIENEFGMAIELMEEKDFFNPYAVRGFFPKCKDMSTDTIQILLAAQNTLSPTQWQEISRKTEGKMEHIVFGVDKTSWDTVKATRGTTAFLFYGVRLVAINKKRWREWKGNDDTPPLPLPFICSPATGPSKEFIKEVY